MNQNTDRKITELREDAAVMYHHGIHATVYTAGGSRRSFGPSPSLKEDNIRNTSEVAYWGSNNGWPQDVIAEVNASGVLRPLIRKRVQMLIAQGLVYGTTTVDPRTGEERMRVMRVREIDEALEDTNHELYLYESASDWYTQGNAFPELQMSYGGEVVGLFAQDASRVRLGVKDKLTGRITKAFVDGDWPGRMAPRDETVRLACLDPYYRPAQQVMNSREARFILPLRLLVDDLDYYGQAPWHGLIESGVLEVAKNIWKLKQHIMENMMVLRFHIEVDNRYWDKQYPGFFSKPLAEQKEIKKKELEAFGDWAAGVEKAGRTLMTAMEVDQVAKLQWSMWKVHELKMELPTGAYVEDSQEADFHIVRAFMDPTLFGIAPGKDRNSAGSGSDKRMAHTHHLLDNYVDANMLLLPFRVMSTVNGWHEKYAKGERIRWWFRGYHAATLDRSLGAVAETPQRDDGTAPNN